jgi:hypothetical protein
MSASTSWRSPSSIVPQPDQPGVGEQLQPQLNPAGVAREPALGEARRLPGGGREALVAVTADAAAGDDRPLSRLDEVVALALEAVGLRTGRNGDHLVGTASPMALLALAVAATTRHMVRGESQGREVTARRIADEDDVASVAAVAAIGATTRHVRLAAQRNRPVSPGTALDVDFRTVGKHRMNGRRVVVYRERRMYPRRHEGPEPTGTKRREELS